MQGFLFLLFFFKNIRAKWRKQNVFFFQYKFYAKKLQIKLCKLGDNFFKHALTRDHRNKEMESKDNYVQ